MNLYNIILYSMCTWAYDQSSSRVIHYIASHHMGLYTWCIHATQYTGTVHANIYYIRPRKINDNGTCSLQLTHK